MPTLEEIKLFAKHHLKRRVYDHPAQDTQMGVVSLGYEPGMYAERIAEFSDRFELRTSFDVSHQGQTHTPFEIASRSPRATRRLLILGGVHGNEQAGILSVPDILELHHRGGARYDRVALHVLTPVNPIGAAFFSRYNAQGFDINRDFVRFETAEARAVRELVERVRPDFILALHEGPQDAAFMFTNQHVARDRAERFLDHMRARGATLASHDYFGRKLQPPGLAPMTRGQLFVVKLWAAAMGMMATNVYAADRGVPEITLESGWRSEDRDARLRVHAALAEALLDYLAG